LLDPLKDDGFLLSYACFNLPMPCMSLRAGAPEALLDALSDSEPYGILEALDFLAANKEGN